MKISYVEDEFNRCGFQATPSGQDGYPKVPFLFTSLAPSWFSGARKSLALGLSFLTSVSGQIVIDGRLSPLTASLLLELVPSGEVFFPSESVEFKPTDIQKGASTLHVFACETLLESASVLSEIVSQEGGYQQTALVLLKDDAVRGFFSTPSSRVVASNYWMLRELANAEEQFLGLAVLSLMYSEDLVASKIVLHGPPPVREEFIKKISNAFYSVGLVLEIEQ